MSTSVLVLVLLMLGIMMGGCLGMVYSMLRKG